MWIPIASAPASRSRSIQTRSSGGSICTWIGRNGTRSRIARDALREVLGAAVGPVGRARRHDHLLDAVEAHRGLGDLGELRRELHLRRRARLQRLLDRAEATARVLVRVADARLHDGRREDVRAVQPRELLVGHAVCGPQVVEARALDGLDHRVLDDHAVAREAPGVVERERRLGRKRQRGGRAAEREVAVVRWAGAGATPHRRRRAQALDGQLGSQVELHFGLRTSRWC